MVVGLDGADFGGVNDGAIGEGSGEDEDSVGNERIGADEF